jgi:hypothetical protein
MKRAKRIATLAAGAAAGASVLIGYAVSGHAAAQATARPIPSTGAPVTLPILVYEPTPAQAAQVKYLAERLTQVCMQGFGFAYERQLSTTAIAQGVRIDQEFESRMYGVSDPVAVREYGYHLPPWTQGPAAPDLIAELPAAELSVFDGTATTYDHRTIPPGGCQGWAVNLLAQHGIDSSTGWPSGAGGASLVAQIQTDTFQKAQTDRRVVSIFGTWSACMRTYGDDYATPFTAAGDPQWSTAAPSAREIEVAEHDIACKSKVRLAAVESAVVAEYQNAAISEDTATLAPLEAQLGAETTAIGQFMARYGG